MHFHQNIPRMLNFFTSISQEQFREQQIALLSSESSKASDILKRKRPPGRPRKVPSINDVLMDTNSVNNSKNTNNEYYHDSVQIDEKSLDKKQKRNHYDWWNTDFIYDITNAYKLNKSGYLTVQYLQKKFPNDLYNNRFTNLAAATIDGWYNKETHQLLPDYEVKLGEFYDSHKELNNRVGILDQYSDVKALIISTLTDLREGNCGMKIRNIRMVMKAAIMFNKPEILDKIKLSNNFIWLFIRNNLHWRVRQKTCSSAKLPVDWESQGRAMIERIAVLVKQYKIPADLIINFDQTGVHLVPSSNSTYAVMGSKNVSVINSDDKRQITVIIASTPSGHLLAPQIIFQGKTDRCHPEATPETIRNRFHITHSENHWSSQITMTEYIKFIVDPFIQTIIEKKNLHQDQKAIIVLDCWSVHKSAEFRGFVKKKYPNLLLVYIPPNCTSKLQVADVALNYSFKHGIKIRYEEWVTRELYKQLQAKQTLNIQTNMAVIKPLILNWCFESWRSLENRQDLIMKGWFKCMDRILDPFNTDVQDKATRKVLESQLEAYGFVPELSEPEPTAAHWDEDSDGETEEDELDVLKRKVEGSRKSTRVKSQTKPAFGNATIRTDQIAIESDSDSEPENLNQVEFV
jgi:hypothetical protein